ncbi:methyl-accepting chemotaxis protein [Erwinia sp. 198]|uniref:methyl-accepting chemotaxis protein n=1 Tax=Erwinia sp. 198 TaxID=2022746 RepID=UPI000F65950C|nr:methyl-accepting chemotaxis protein [Erwinia sp. 198]RRZ89307.1 HAMP domain-containing protein [Erwinia sp. 198]
MSVFSRIKTSSFLLSTIVAFGTLQLVAGILFLSALHHNKESFETASKASDRVTALTNAWYELNAARADVNRVVIWLQKEGPTSSIVSGMVAHGKAQLALADRDFNNYQNGPVLPGLDATLNSRLAQSYQAYAGQLNQLMEIASRRDLTGLFSINVAGNQKIMQGDYDRWRAAVGQLSKITSAESKQVFTQMLWLMGAILLVVLSAVIVSWSVIKRVLIQPLARALGHINAIEQGNLTEQIAVDARARNEMGHLLSGLAVMQQSLVRTVGNVRNGADTILTGVSEIAAGNNDLSSRTEEQAASLEQTAASMEQLTATVKQNADNSHQAAKLALSAAQTAEKGGAIVDGVIKSIFGLQESSKKIAEITGVIESIAFQTNILALNAAVEAARAGENGRGFAVVAGEVRSLAQRSAVAAKDINALIAESSARVDSGSRLAGQAEESMSGILSSVQQVRDIMDEISSASEEQSRGISQVGIAVSELDQVTQQNAALVEQSSSAAASLEEQAARLNEAVAVFRLAGRKEVARRSGVTAQKLPVLASASTDNWEAF